MIRQFTIALSLAVAFGVTQPAFAQGRGFRGDQGLSPTRLSPTLQATLKLTDDQKAKLEAIETRARDERRALFQGGGGESAFEQARTISQKAEMEGLAL